MKAGIILFILFLMYWKVFGQMPIYDMAIEAQQERMVFKTWDRDKFYPKPHKVIGVPTNPGWYITWALHPNYPTLDRRPLSASGEQTQRIGLAAAMNISSNHYKKESDSVRMVASKELGRISGALSVLDPLYQLYYKIELQPLEEFEANAFNNYTQDVQDHLSGIGALDWYLENMRILAGRYSLARSLDMERGQRILMYHRILLEMRGVIKKWEWKKALSQQMMIFRISNRARKRKEGLFSGNPGQDQDQIIKEIINNRIVLK